LGGQLLATAGASAARLGLGEQEEGQAGPKEERHHISAKAQKLQDSQHQAFLKQQRLGQPEQTMQQEPEGNVEEEGESGESLKFNTVVLLQPGDYTVSLMQQSQGRTGFSATAQSDSIDSSDMSLRAAHNESYLVIHVGNAGTSRDQQWPEGLIVFPQLDSVINAAEAADALRWSAEASRDSTAGRPEATPPRGLVEAQASETDAGRQEAVAHEAEGDVSSAIGQRGDVRTRLCDTR